jgi:phosphatidylserine decarboxylase
MYLTNLTSRVFGRFASHKFDNRVQNVINKTYVMLMGLDMSEFKPYCEYKSLNDLFTRALHKKRYINKNKEVIISPCDSLVTLCESIKNLNQVAQIKGKNYNLDELLTNKITKTNLNKLVGGEYINMYLSPKDYHRYHCPCDMTILKSIYVPAKLFPVNNIALKFVKNLFVKNERVILECKANDKIFYMVFVGALNVGGMVFNFDKDITTNNKVQKIKTKTYKKMFVKKASKLGYFKMGSTILMFYPKDMVTQDKLTNKNIKFGNKIASFA